MNRASKRRLIRTFCALGVMCLMVCAEAKVLSGALQPTQDLSPGGNAAQSAGSGGSSNPNSTRPRSQDDGNGPAISEARLKTYYLVRENGELAPFFDLPFEEFEAIYRLYAGIDDEAEQPNRFHVNEIAVEARVRDNLVYLESTFSIRSAADGWIRVPLRLDNCRLSDSDTSLDPSVAFLTVENEGEGLVCWLNGKQGEISELRLNLVRPLEAASTTDPFRIRLSLPKAASSKLTLDVPMSDAVFTARDEAILQETSHPDPQTTRFVVLGRPSGGGYDFSWGSPRQRSALETRLVVTSETEILVESAGQVRWQATMDVEGGGRSIESFEVLLPQNATLITQEAPGYTLEQITEATPTDAAAATEDQSISDALTDLRPRVRVRMLRPETRLSNIKIDARIRWGDDGNDPLIDSSGYREIPNLEVVNAVRHTGEVNVYAVNREWVVDSEPRNGLAHDSVPSVGELGGTPVAGFSFSRQPSSLGLRSEKQPTRISIEPVVTLIATRTGIQMEGVYRVALSGSPATRLQVDAGIWEIDSITAEDSRGAGNIIRDYEKDSQIAGRYTIFLNSDAMSGQSSFVLRILGRQELVAGDRQVELAFPSPVNATVGPTTLLVRQEESLVMRPERVLLKPALASTIPEWYRAGDDDPPDAVYRGSITSAGEEVTFTVTVRPRTVSHRIRVEPRLNDQQIQVRSVIDLDIKHQSLRQLELLVPTVLLEESDLIVRTDEEEWIWTRSDIAPGNDSPLTALPLEFAEGQLGRLALNLEYQVPADGTQSNRGDGLSSAAEALAGDEDSSSSRGEVPSSVDRELWIPFVQPFVRRTPVPLDAGVWPIISPAELLRAALGDQMQHRSIEVRLTHPLNVDVHPADNSWDPSGMVERDGQLISTFTSSQPHPEGMLRFRTRSGLARAGYQVSIEKCWLQTQMTKSDRQDRVVFAFRTDQPEVYVDLPLGASLMNVALDDRAIVAPRTEALNGRQRVLLRLANRSSIDANSARNEDNDNQEVSVDQPYTLELWYRFPERESVRWPLQVEWPVLQGITWVDRTYWQLILPRTEHLAWADDNFGMEQDWRFGPLLFERRSRMTQQALEEWVGVAPQADATIGGNSYLFSSFGKVTAGRVGTIDRRFLLLVGCTFTFLVGVALIYVRVMRSPIVLITLAVAVVGAAFIQLELGILIAQIAFVALIGVAAMMLIRAAIGTPHVSLRSDLMRDVSETGSTVTRSSGSRTPASSRNAAPAEPVAVSSSHAETS